MRRIYADSIVALDLASPRAGSYAAAASFATPTAAAIAAGYHAPRPGQSTPMHPPPPTLCSTSRASGTVWVGMQQPNDSHQ
jgi:hypothetical protein